MRTARSTSAIDKRLGPQGGHHQGRRQGRGQEPRAAVVGRTTTRRSRTRWRASSTRRRYSVGQGHEAGGGPASRWSREANDGVREVRPGGQGAEARPRVAAAAAHRRQPRAGRGQVQARLRQGRREVVYNRLKPNNTETNGLLEFDSTINYIKSESTLDIGSVDNLRKINDPVQHVQHQGTAAGADRQPGPGRAQGSALNPDQGRLVLLRLDRPQDKTLFAETNEEHEAQP